LYVERFWVKNRLGDVIFDLNFSNHDEKIYRWSLFQNVEEEITDSERTLFFKFLSVCLGGTRYLPRLKEEISEVYGRINKIAGFGATIRSDIYKNYFYRSRNDYIVSPGGIVEPVIKKSCKWRGYYTTFKGFTDFKKPFGDFAYGFNSARTSSTYQEIDLDFPHRRRSSRFGTFFDDEFPLTPVTAWLHKQYGTTTHNSIKGASLYNTMLTALSNLFSHLKFSHCGKDKLVFAEKTPGQTEKAKKALHTLLLSDFPQDQINLIDFLVDFIRQLADSRKLPNDFNLSQGILFINHFEQLFSTCQINEATKALENLFPNIQFIIECSKKSSVDWIGSIQNQFLPILSAVNRANKFVTARSTSDRKTWDYRNKFLKSRFRKTAPANKDDVVLIDVDSMIPNLALMKLSRHYKNQCRNVILTKESEIHRKSRLVFASCVFYRNSTVKKIERLRELHGENIQIGGTGVDLTLTLPDKIEHLMPDYSLYPNLDFALGFLTRGCQKSCDFCIVPDKEGMLRQVAKIDDILPPEFNKLVLMDNNLLAHPEADNILEEMIERRLQVNFNQTLDIHLINKKNASLLQKIDSKNYSFTKRMYYFSFNTPDTISVIREKLKLLDSVKPTEIRFVCMYGYNTTLSEDIERFSFLQKMGTSPFVQRYQPVLGARLSLIDNYFDTDVDQLLRIHFAQNGRIFENFLRWVSKRYVKEFGKLYMPLVDLIFKYNNKHRKHRYIESLAGTKKNRPTQLVGI